MGLFLTFLKLSVLIFMVLKLTFIRNIGSFNQIETMWNKVSGGYFFYLIELIVTLLITLLTLLPSSLPFSSVYTTLYSR